MIPQFTKAAAAGDVAGRAVPVQRHLPHGERLAGLPPAARTASSPTSHSHSPAAARSSRTTRASSTARASTPSAFGIAVQQGGSSTRRGSTRTTRRRPGTRSSTPATSSRRPASSRSRGGVKDGFLGEWYLVNSLTQNLDSAGRRAQPVHRRARLARPAVPRALVEARGAVRRTATSTTTPTSLELYQGIQLFDTGKACDGFNTTPALPNSQKKLGEDNVGYFVMPTFGTGAMAGIPITDTQGFGIPTKAKDPETRGEVHRLHALAGARAGEVDAVEAGAGRHAVRRERDRRPADQGDLRQVDRRQAQRLHRRPDADAVLDGRDVRRLAEDPRRQHDRRAGRAELAADVTQKWKKQNPDMVENYRPGARTSRREATLAARADRGRRPAAC